MIVTNLSMFRDGGTIGIYCDNNTYDMRYHCNPGIWGTKAALGKPGNAYNPTPIDKEEMQQLKVALTLYRTADPHQQELVNTVLGVMHEVYGIEL